MFGVSKRYRSIKTRESKYNRYTIKKNECNIMDTKILQKTGRKIRKETIENLLIHIPIK